MRLRALFLTICRVSNDLPRRLATVNAVAGRRHMAPGGICKIAHGPETKDYRDQNYRVFAIVSAYLGIGGDKQVLNDAGTSVLLRLIRFHNQRHVERTHVGTDRENRVIY